MKGTTRPSLRALAPTSDSPPPPAVPPGGSSACCRGLGFPFPSLEDPLRLSDLLPAAQIRIDLPAATKREAIEALVALLPIPDPSRRREVVAAVLERESALSTGIGRGVAVPHGKTPAVPRLMAALGTVPGGLPFDAVDGEPCRIFILLVSDPESAGPHVRALAQVARILNREAAKRALVGARTPEEVQAVFREDEKREKL